MERLDFGRTQAPLAMHKLMLTRGELIALQRGLVDHHDRLMQEEGPATDHRDLVETLILRLQDELICAKA